MTQKTLGNLPGANKFDQAAPGMPFSQSLQLAGYVHAMYAPGNGSYSRLTRRCLDTAGRAGTTSDAPKAGQSVKDTVGAAKSKVDEGAGKAKKFFGLF